VIVTYVGFFASGSVLAGQAVAEPTHTGDTTGIVVFAAVTALVATVGVAVAATAGEAFLHSQVGYVVALGGTGAVACIALITVAGTAVALAGKDTFLASFKDFQLFLPTFFTPWSAINLVDRYLISRERYDIPALADPHGRYGAWRWDALAVYAAGLPARLPFLATGLWTGPLVARLGGADVSWIVGLAVPALLYRLLARRSAARTASAPVPGGEAAPARR
jgi:NCS1 family nucleobase:cation symporter-1